MENETKPFRLAAAVIITVLILAWCGSNNKSENELSVDFFIENIEGEISISAFFYLLIRIILKKRQFFLKKCIREQK